MTAGLSSNDPVKVQVLKRIAQMDVDIIQELCVLEKRHGRRENVVVQTVIVLKPRRGVRVTKL